MAGNLVAIHHIGSTAIPGIHAKPVIDMLAVVDDITRVDASNAELIAVGYVAMGEFGLAGRRYFRRDNAAGERTHQIHTFEIASPAVARHLAFRDYMRAHPAIADEYSRLKQGLATRHADDMNAYMDGKDAFIKEHESKALRWAATGSDV